MSATSKTITIETRGRGTHEITRQVQDAVAASGIRDGLCTVFIHHTSASLIINENADLDVQRDLDAFLSRLVPDGDLVHVADRHWYWLPRTGVSESALSVGRLETVFGPMTMRTLGTVERMRRKFPD